MKPLPWHERGTLLGVTVRVYFCAPARGDDDADAALEALPILRAPGVLMAARPQVLPGDGDRRMVYRSGWLHAAPDLVLRHGDGLISVLARGADARPPERSHWLARLPANRMLQALATAMAVAGQTQRPTAAVWRAAHALYQFEPDAALLALLAGLAPEASRSLGLEGPVSADQLASFCEPRLRAMLGAGRRTDALLTD